MFGCGPWDPLHLRMHRTRRLHYCLPLGSPAARLWAIPRFSRIPNLIQSIANGLQRLLVTTFTTETRPPPRRFQGP